MSENSEQGGPPAKTESPTYKRLPSFRSPRDLKLTEFQKITNPPDPKKKVYKPNLNVQRKKHTDEGSSKEEKSGEEKAGGGVGVDRTGVKGGRLEKTRKKQPNLIQTSGVFSDGLAPSIKTSSRWTNRFSMSSSPNMMLSRPSFKGVGKVDKEEEALVRKQLLRDDFIDDPTCLPDASQSPISLPLNNFGGDIYMKSEEELKKLDERVKGIKVKVEGGGEPGGQTEGVVCGEKPRTMADMTPLTVSQLMAQSSETGFFFLQLPHCMPREKMFLPANSKQKPGAHSAAIASASSTAHPPLQTEEKCVLRNLPEGKIGKLQLLKSGQARLLLGDANFIIDSGTQPSFKQDVVAVVDMTSSTKTGNMVHIGNISSRLIVSPDWHSLLH